MLWRALTTSFNLGLRQIKPSVCVPTYRCLWTLFLHKNCCSVFSKNCQRVCQSCQPSGQFVFRRGFADDRRRNQSAVSYVIATFIFMVGAAYAGVPLYRMICQVSDNLGFFLFCAFTYMCVCFMLFVTRH